MKLKFKKKEEKVKTTIILPTKLKAKLQRKLKKENVSLTLFVTTCAKQYVDKETKSLDE